MTITKSESDHVIDTLDDLFVFLGASDVKFRSDHYSYPGSQAFQSSKENVIGYAGSPVLSGLFGSWESSFVFLRDGVFSVFSGQDLHWSEIVRVYSPLDPVMRALGNTIRHTTADHDSYGHFNYREIDWSGRVRFHRRDNYAFKGPVWYGLGTTTLVHRSENKKDDPSDKWIREGHELVMSFAASEPAFWLAKVKLEPDVPGLSLLSDAIGIRELLKVRDIPQGRKRRSALLHWVSEHWRKCRNDPESESLVRKHLRGETKCAYKSYLIDIQASREDNLENMLSGRRRDAMRGESPRRDKRIAGGV